MVFGQFVTRYKLQLLSLLFLPSSLLFLTIVAFNFRDRTCEQSTHTSPASSSPSTTFEALHILVKTALITVNHAYPLLL